MVLNTSASTGYKMLLWYNTASNSKVDLFASSPEAPPPHKHEDTDCSESCDCHCPAWVFGDTVIHGCHLVSHPFTAKQIHSVMLRLVLMMRDVRFLDDCCCLANPE